MFKCKIELEGSLKKLSLEDGLHLKEFGELISKLAKCIENDNIKFTVTGIEGNSYDAIVETDTIEGVEKFYEVHEKIKDEEYEELPDEYQEYANCLQRICFRNNIILKASSNALERTPVEIRYLKNANTDFDYSVITSITGKVVSLVGKNENNPYVTVETHRAEPLKIFVKGEQERTLSKFYKDYFIRFRIKTKRDSQGEFKSAVLIDFTVPKYTNLKTALEDVKQEFGDVFANIKDSAKLIRELRNDKEETPRL